MKTTRREVVITCPEDYDGDQGYHLCEREQGHKGKHRATNWWNNVFEWWSAEQEEEALIDAKQVDKQ